MAYRGVGEEKGGCGERKEQDDAGSSEQVRGAGRLGCSGRD